MNTHFKTILTFVGVFVIIPLIGWLSMLALGLDVVGSAIRSYYIAGVLIIALIGVQVLACVFIYNIVYSFWDGL